MIDVELIRSLCMAKGWTLKELFKRAGIHKNTFARLSKKKRGIHPKTLGKIADALEVEPKDLLTRLNR